MSSYLSGEIYGDVLSGPSFKRVGAAVRNIIPKRKLRRMLRAPGANLQQRVMAYSLQNKVTAAMHGDDDFLGGKLGKFVARFDMTSKKQRKALVKTVQKVGVAIDPTSSKIGGKIYRGVLGVGAAVGGTLIGIPPTVSYAAVTGGLKGVGAIRGKQKSNAKIKKANKAIAAQIQQNVISQADAVNTGASTGYGTQSQSDPGTQDTGTQQTGTQETGEKKSSMLPLLGIGAASIAALTML